MKNYLHIKVRERAAGKAVKNGFVTFSFFVQATAPKTLQLSFLIQQELSSPQRLRMQTSRRCSFLRNLRQWKLWFYRSTVFADFIKGITEHKILSPLWSAVNWNLITFTQNLTLFQETQLSANSNSRNSYKSEAKWDRNQVKLVHIFSFQGRICGLRRSSKFWNTFHFKIFRWLVKFWADSAMSSFARP